jgi:putative transposase
MCEVLEIHRSTYYKYRHTLDSDYPEYQMMKELFRRHKKTLGYRRMTQVLATELGVVMNHKKVLRILSKYGLRATYIKKLRPNYSKQRNQGFVQADHLQRHFNQRGWVTDITYLMMTTNGKRAYLSTIMDLETRQWVAYNISTRNNIELVVNTLHNALQNNKEKDLNGLILHSDQGSQYPSTEYQQIFLSNGIIVSHARKANPLDNAVIESFHSLLKKETLYNYPITTLEQYISMVHEWMAYYNTTRP